MEAAIVDAAPIPNMLAFYAALGDGLPDAHHVILSARTPAMRTDTLTWLSNHGLAPADGMLWFVPRAAAKTRVWKTLTRAGQLVIVDDLTYDHEAEAPRVYHDLVEADVGGGRAARGLARHGRRLHRLRRDRDDRTRRRGNPGGRR